MHFDLNVILFDIILEWLLALVEIIEVIFDFVMFLDKRKSSIIRMKQL
jgi:hypothetical protein